MQKFSLVLLPVIAFGKIAAATSEIPLTNIESNSQPTINRQTDNRTGPTPDNPVSSSAASTNEAASDWTISPCGSEFTPATASYNFIKNLKTQDVAPGSRIRKIHYTRLPIFDESNPKEDNFLFRWANRFHAMTKEYVVDDIVLFEEGRHYDAREIEESARLLRDQKYLYDANIRPVAVCNDEIDVEVITKDVWSFSPDFSFKRSGGESEHRVAIRDTNILGTGKQLSLASKKDFERHSTELIYKDANISGSRVATRLEYSDNDDGSNQFVRFALPFYSLDSKRGWQVHLEKIDRADTQFFRGEDITETRHRINDYIADYGFSGGLIDGKTRRWSIGYRYRKDRFFPGIELPPTFPFPDDKQYGYPYFSFESIEDNFVKTFDLDQIHRTEDLHLGTKIFLRAGYADRAFGSNQDRFAFDGAGSQALYHADKTLLKHWFQWSGLWNFDTRKTEDFILNYEMRYFRGQTKHRSFAAIFNASYTKNLNTNDQVFLGGETGLRGFKNRFQTGDRKVLLNLEERMYSDIHILNLIRVGWAIFVDVGRAWKPGFNNGSDNDYLVDAGLGLRLASSKADTGKILHVDLAYPLNWKSDPEVDSVQFLVTIKDAF